MGKKAKKNQINKQVKQEMKEFEKKCSSDKALIIEALEKQKKINKRNDLLFKLKAVAWFIVIIMFLGGIINKGDLGLVAQVFGVA